MNNINLPDFLNRGSPFKNQSTPKEIQSPMKQLLRNKSFHLQHKGKIHFF